jgi:hypothetical protein
MGVDLHFIGSGISSGDSHNGFGKIVSNPAGNFPPAGSYAGTLYGVEYPIELGGEFFANPVTNEDEPNQTCDVDELNDGSGGTYLDATSVTNINYIPTATLFATGGTFDSSQTPVEVPSGSGEYYDSEFSYTYYYHDGSGLYYTEVDHWQYFSNGTNIVEDYTAYQIEVPNGSGNYFGTGKYDTYNWNGSGGVTTLTNQGSYYPNNTFIAAETNSTEVPSGSGTFMLNGTTTTWRWNGSGGITTTVSGSYYPYGTAIYSFYDEENSQEVYFKWNGSGGYYTE